MLDESARLGAQIELARQRDTPKVIETDFAGLEARVVAWVERGPSAQHKAECDCAEFYGDKCKWPACDLTDVSPTGRLPSMPRDYFNCEKPT